jgi:hypothetical protein
VTAVDLAAWRTLAASVLTDYQRAAETEDTAGRAMWGARLADALGGLLAALDAPAATPRPAAPGPLETEAQARELPAVRAVYDAFDADPGVGKMAPHNFLMLVSACEAAGGRPQQSDVVRSPRPGVVGGVGAGHVRRGGGADLARRRGCVVTAPAGYRLIGPAVTGDQREVLAAALSDAIGYREARGSGDYCTDCEARASGICDDHAADLDLAVAYQLLADELAVEVSDPVNKHWARAVLAVVALVLVHARVPVAPGHLVPLPVLVLIAAVALCGGGSPGRGPGLEAAAIPGGGVMDFYAAPGPPGMPGPEEEPDPMRRANAKLVEHIAFLLETGEQMWERAGEVQLEHEDRITALEKTVTVLEALVVGESAGGTR